MAVAADELSLQAGHVQFIAFYKLRSLIFSYLSLDILVSLASAARAVHSHQFSRAAQSLGIFSAFAVSMGGLYRREHCYPRYNLRAAVAVSFTTSFTSGFQKEQQI